MAVDGNGQGYLSGFQTHGPDRAMSEEWNRSAVAVVTYMIFMHLWKSYMKPSQEALSYGMA